ncbi:MAG: HU family DNA-binding protein [Chloroflexi bacterium]|nr:HU family DNA-binding protein [Chloroflexota bacterium]
MLYSFARYIRYHFQQRSNQHGKNDQIRVHKPATPEKPGINPFTKQPITVKAKPASTAVRANPVKALKDAIK